LAGGPAGATFGSRWRGRRWRIEIVEERQRLGLVLTGAGSAGRW
jgi:hypothetical protein